MVMDINIPVIVAIMLMKQGTNSNISKENKVVILNIRTARTPKPVL